MLKMLRMIVSAIMFRIQNQRVISELAELQANYVPGPSDEFSGTINLFGANDHGRQIVTDRCCARIQYCETVHLRN